MNEPQPANPPPIWRPDMRLNVDCPAVRAALEVVRQVADERKGVARGG